MQVSLIDPIHRIVFRQYHKRPQDLLHTSDPCTPWPAWLDTVGLDEGDADHVNGELVRRCWSPVTCHPSPFLYSSYADTIEL